MRISDWSSDVCSSDLERVDRFTGHVCKARNSYQNDEKRATQILTLSYSPRPVPLTVPISDCHNAAASRLHQLTCLLKVLCPDQVCCPEGFGITQYLRSAGLSMKYGRA